MSGLSPTGPAQPPLDAAYTTSSNPVSKEPLESAQSRANAQDDSGTTDIRIPTSQSGSQADAMPTSLARGVRGADAGEEAKGLRDEDVGRHRELDAEQMGAPGEGKVYDAVSSHEFGGRTGGQEGLESDLDR